ncbi:hypothetical protein QYM36_005383 [Artemia franciscana]|uniref:Glucosamine/galactosamine-6-phosphate isomerase domain-containing protein n=1 Tax=Artemia franciscana TaxID=6661 RepID=A0AA88IDP4_ARTSF|nr:hypothetical protein QYM36_005383 [Artemia franciscana]
MVDFLCTGFLRREAKADVTKWKFFFCDEKKVPFHHSESTFETYKRKLLAILPIDEKQFIPGWVRMDTPAEVFPDHPLLEEHERLVAPIEDSPKEPPFRVTFTFPLLNAAKLCVFALSGDSKSDMVARILQNQEDFLAGRVYPLVGTVLWLLDQRAASQLEVTLET